MDTNCPGHWAVVIRGFALTEIWRSANRLHGIRMGKSRPARVRMYTWEYRDDFILVSVVCVMFFFFSCFVAASRGLRASGWSGSEGNREQVEFLCEGHWEESRDGIVLYRTLFRGRSVWLQPQRRCHAGSRPPQPHAQQLWLQEGSRTLRALQMDTKMPGKYCISPRGLRSIFV